MRTRIWTAVSVASLVLAMPVPAHAAHHLWRLHQLFSNASGSVQFIELETATGGSTGETNLSGQTLVAGGNTLDFTNLTPGASGATNWLLIGTSNVGTLPGGVTPDFTVSGPFFSTGGGTITYASGVDSWAYGTVPTDGVNALTRDVNDTESVTVAVNAPTNLAGVAGQLSLAAPAAPALPRWALALGLGAILLAGSGLVGPRRRAAT